MLEVLKLNNTYLEKVLIEIGRMQSLRTRIRMRTYAGVC
jgi:hypothetical protein